MGSGFLARLFGGGSRTPADLAKLLGRPEADLAKVQVRYRTFTIPKRGGGTRTLKAPEEGLKRLQRRLLRKVLGGLQPHVAATGFRRGLSIVDHAKRHAGKPLVIKIDLEDFFPSTKAARVDALYKSLRWNGSARELLLAWTTLDGSLPQGAPTSPLLSNLVNQNLDFRLACLAEAAGGGYARYADDLTFSFPKPPGADFLGTVRKILAEEGYRVQERKRIRVLKACRRQRVLGLVVNNPKPALPRETRRWLRAVRHRMKTGKPPTLTPKQLQGWEAFAKMVSASP